MYHLDTIVIASGRFVDEADIIKKVYDINKKPLFKNKLRKMIIYTPNIDKYKK